MFEWLKNYFRKKQKPQTKHRVLFKSEIEGLVLEQYGLMDDNLNMTDSGEIRLPSVEEMNEIYKKTKGSDSLDIIKEEAKRKYSDRLPKQK